MTRFRVRDVLDSTGATQVPGRGAIDLDAILLGVSTDTRKLRAGELFFALSGLHFDGNEFAVKAAAAGAGLLILRGSASAVPPVVAELPSEAVVVLHEDPRRALGDLAAWHRSHLSIPVVGITGSCGKTTTKNILVQLLGARRRVVGSPSSYNNDVGVPLTLLLADEDTEVLVVEIGTNRPGEIAALCRIARPTAGIVTNVGASHLEGLHSIEGVGQEKSELFASLPRDGFAVLNMDCASSEMLRSATAAPKISFSVEGDGDLDAIAPWFHSSGSTFRLEGREVTSPLLGTHNIHNLLAALAACRGLGLELEEVLPEVAHLTDGRRRLERRELAGISILDDTYNANPDSARAGVRVLCGIHGVNRRVLVLGEMLELGERAPELHHAVGRDAARGGIDLLIGVGELCRAAAAGALEGGLAPDRVIHLATLREALERVPPLLEEGDAVLLKASRRSGLEQVVGAVEKARARISCGGAA